MAQVFLRASLLGTLVVLRTCSYVLRCRRPNSCKEVADMQVCVYIYIYTYYMCIYIYILHTHPHPHPYMRNYSSGDMLARACGHTSYACYRNKHMQHSLSLSHPLTSLSLSLSSLGLWVGFAGALGLLGSGPLSFRVRFRVFPSGGRWAD